MPTYRIETSAIASVTLYIDADTPDEALRQAREASEAGGMQLHEFLRGVADVDAEDIESLALDTAHIEDNDL